MYILIGFWYIIISAAIFATLNSECAFNDSIGEQAAAAIFWPVVTVLIVLKASLRLLYKYFTSF